MADGPFSIRSMRSGVYKIPLVITKAKHPKPYRQRVYVILPQTCYETPADVPEDLEPFATLTKPAPMGRPNWAQCYNSALMNPPMLGKSIWVALLLSEHRPDIKYHYWCWDICIGETKETAMIKSDALPRYNGKQKRFSKFILKHIIVQP